MTYIKRSTNHPNNLKECRTNRALTQQALATKAGVALRTVNGLEQGCMCRPETAEKILKALDLPFRKKTEVFPSFNWTGLGPMEP